MWELRHYDSTSVSLYAVMVVVKLLQRLIRKAACMDGSLADNLSCVPLVDKRGHHNGLHACFLWTLELHILCESAAGMESFRNEIHWNVEKRNKYNEICNNKSTIPCTDR